MADRTLPMSYEEAYNLRQIRFEDMTKIFRNNRPIQATNGRQIVKYSTDH